MKTKTILIADDDQNLRTGLETVFGESSLFDIVGTARNGEEAVSSFHAHYPDVLLTDYKMPYKSGIEVIAALRPHYPDARLILMSSWLTEAQIEYAYEMGASAVFIKDDKLLNLPTKIDAIIENNLPIPTR